MPRRIWKEKMAPPRQMRFSARTEERIKALHERMMGLSGGVYISLTDVYRRAVEIGLDVLEARQGEEPKDP